MQTIFSHIVQKRLSQEHENIATEALTFILNSNNTAYQAFMNLLRLTVEDLPALDFKQQKGYEDKRPDIIGQYVEKTYVVIENKFWAGLTENQPVEYLKYLSENSEQSLLLFIVPKEREIIIQNEISRRLDKEGASYTENTIKPFSFYCETSIKPIVSILSWKSLLQTLENELVDEPRWRNEIYQLRSLCDAADNLAFIPFSSSELTNQRIPSLMLQLSSVIQRTIERGVAEGFLSIKGALPQASWERIGRYFLFLLTGEETVHSCWIGTSLNLWKEDGMTPIWLVLYPKSAKNAESSKNILEPWAKKKNYYHGTKNDAFYIGLPIITGEEEDIVVNGMLNILKEIRELLVNNI